MNPLSELGKMFFFFGALLLLLGAFFSLGGKISWLGRLPGDIFIQRKGFQFYFPLATSLLMSLLLTLLFSFFRKK